MIMCFRKKKNKSRSPTPAVTISSPCCPSLRHFSPSVISPSSPRPLVSPFLRFPVSPFLRFPVSPFLRFPVSPFLRFSVSLFPRFIFSVLSFLRFNIFRKSKGRSRRIAPAIRLSVIFRPLLVPQSLSPLVLPSFPLSFS